MPGRAAAVPDRTEPGRRIRRTGAAQSGHLGIGRRPDTVTAGRLDAVALASAKRGGHEAQRGAGR